MYRSSRCLTRTQSHAFFFLMAAMCVRNGMASHCVLRHLHLPPLSVQLPSITYLRNWFSLIRTFIRSKIVEERQRRRVCRTVTHPEPSKGDVSPNGTPLTIRRAEAKNFSRHPFIRRLLSSVKAST